MVRQSGRQRRSPNPPLETLPWLDDGELALTLSHNWGVGPGGAAATIQVIAGTINQGAMENQTLTLPTSH